VIRLSITKLSGLKLRHSFVAARSLEMDEWAIFKVEVLPLAISQRGRYDRFLRQDLKCVLFQPPFSCVNGKISNPCVLLL
jgi:hypothetical protein